MSFAETCYLLNNTLPTSKLIKNNESSSSAHEPNYESELLPNYCDETTYKFAFYTLIIAYIFMLLVVGLFCGMCCCMCCCTCVGAAAIAARRNSVSSNEQQQQQQQQQQPANNA